MNSETTKLLIAAKRLIEKGWRKTTFAGLSCGTPVLIDHPNACQFCAEGAIVRITMKNNVDIKIRERAEKILRLIIKIKYNTYSIAKFNDADTTSKQDVLDVFDQAIEASKK